jgi:hypothetical protein
MPPPCHIHVLITNKTVQFPCTIRQARSTHLRRLSENLERSRDILSVDTEEGQNIIECLKKEVDKMIMYIMGYETTANSHIDSGKE